MRKLVAALAAASALVSVPAVFGAVEERYSVGLDPAGRAFSRSLVVVVASPAEYERDYIGRLGNDGAWKGPRYQATGNASLAGESQISWGVSVERGSSARATIVDNLGHDWPLIEEGTEPIERRVGGREAGTIAGSWVLTRSTFYGAVDAAYEAGVAFRLCGGPFVLVQFGLLLPSGDSAGGAMGFGEYLVKGTTLPTVWNRQQALESIRGVGLEGSLPASRVTAKRNGSRVAGTVADCNGHPVASTPVTLQRRPARQNGQWLTVARGRTNAGGTFTLPARAPGVYRAVAGTKRSAQIRVG